MKRILVCVLCSTERTGWVNPWLTLNLLLMLRDPRFEVAYQPVCDYRPFDFARNRTVDLARSMGADWLISFDNDNFCDFNPLDIIAEAGEHKDIIGLSCGVGVAPACAIFPVGNHGAVDGNFREEECVGGAVLIIRNAVWQKIPRGPWFRWQHADNELLAPGVGAKDEVRYFLDLARQSGFRVWTHLEMVAGHLKTSNVTQVARVLDALSGGTWGREEGELDAGRAPEGPERQ